MIVVYGEEHFISIKHKKRGYDRLFTLEVNGKLHYIYEEEGEIRGYGMGAYADTMYYYEISRAAYEQEVLPEEAHYLMSLGRNVSIEAVPETLHGLLE